jgi:hypothetical protein
MSMFTCFKDRLVTMLHWINDHCRSRSIRSPHRDLRTYVVVLDDQAFLNLTNIQLFVRSIDLDPEMTTYERRTLITGYRMEKIRPQRDPSHRWFVSTTDYPYNMYPPYLLTECFLMTRYAAHLFYLASHYTRLFPFDHVYLGLVAYAMSIDVMEKNSLFLPSRLPSSKENMNPSAICISNYHSKRLVQLWNEIYRTNISLD